MTKQSVPGSKPASIRSVRGSIKDVKFPPIKSNVRKAQAALPTDVITFSEPPSTHWFLKGSEIKLEVASSFPYEGFPLCCGAAIISGFSGYANDTNARRRIRHSITRAIQERKGMLLAIVNHTQVANNFHKALEAEGFEFVYQTTNPNHSDMSVLHLMALNLSKNLYDKNKLAYKNHTIS